MRLVKVFLRLKIETYRLFNFKLKLKLLIIPMPFKSLIISRLYQCYAEAPTLLALWTFLGTEK